MSDQSPSASLATSAGAPHPPLTLRDLVFVGVLAAAMVALTRGVYPIAVLIGGPVLGPGIVHHSLYAIPLGALVTLGYLRVAKAGTVLLLGLVFSILNVLSIGLWFVFIGFWSGALLGELGLFGLRRMGLDKTDGALALVGGLFVGGLSFFLPILFAIFTGRGKAGAVVYGIALLSWILPAILGAAGGYLGGRIASLLRPAGLIP